MTTFSAASTIPSKRDKIKSIDFAVFSSDELLKLAVTKVTVPSTHSGSLPTCQGPNDIRLGSTDRRLKCATCQRSCSECYGHVGAIPLAFPIYNVSYLDHILKCLKCVCYYCSSLILSDSHIAQLKKTPIRERKKKMALAAAFSKAKRACASCGGFNPVYSKQGLVIKADFSKVVFSDPDEAQYCSRPFTSSEARTILQNISDADCVTLGLRPQVTRPENFVMTVFCVVPPVIRPSVLISFGSRSRGNDDLTAKICDIIKANNNIRAILEKEAQSIPEVGLSIAAQTAVNELTFHAGTFANNDIRGQKPSFQRTGVPSKSIMSRLKGKDGRIRGTLMGKRVDFSARSVISPDPTIDVDEIGVPFKVAQTETVPEKITDLNIAQFRKRVRHGADFWLGAYSIIRDSTLVLLEFADCEKEANQLKIGDVVERYLADGDVVLFNRQPSLHKGSMMGFQVKLMSCKTFRMNLACAPSFNADADGDEMNVHVLQDAESQTEARTLMAAALQIVSPQSNKPCMGLVQDSLLGSYLICHDSVLLTRMQMCELRSVLRYPRAADLPISSRELHGAPVWTGRQAMEMMFPADLHYTNNKASPPVNIRKGIFLQGRLCKLSLGTTYGSLVHMLWLDYSPAFASQFMSDVQRLIMRFLMWYGFSVRFSDCLTTKDVQDRVKTIIQFAEDKVKKLEANPALESVLPGDTEKACNRIANHVLTNIGKVVHAAMDQDRNALSQTVNSGSKGNLINVAQIMGSVGQQSLEGKRIPSVANGNRRIPANKEDDSLLRPYGFVCMSFVKGLRPDEFFFANVSGREGLIDTSVKTATTGYMQRRLMKALETLKVEYDRTVRNSRDDIIQFVYGADDYDACFLLRVDINFVFEKKEDLLKDLREEERGPFSDLLDVVRRARVSGRGDVDTSAFSPLHLEALLRKIQRRLQQQQTPSARQHGTRAAAVSPQQLHQWREELCQALCSLTFGRRAVQELFLRWNLRTKFLVSLAVEPSDLQLISTVLHKQVSRAVVDAAEMVGPQASTSVSNPLTQMVLNTFHYSGVAAKNVTLGVPRIKELIDVAKTIRTPTMYLFPHPSLCKGQALKFLQNSLVHFAIGKAVSHSEILFEPNFFHSDNSEQEKYLAQVSSLLHLQPETFNPYVCVMRLVKEPLLERNLTPADLAEIIDGHFSPHLYILYSEAPMTEWILKIRALGSGVGSTQFADKPVDEQVFLKHVTSDICDKICRDCFLSGIPGVKAVDVSSSVLCTREGDDGDIQRQDVVVLETDGSNLLGALGLAELDGALCTSNDVVDVYNTLGIEAATQVLFQELQTTIGFDGNFINPRHLALLVSLMTHNKTFCPISRHGLNRLPDSSVLAKCSFEETCDMLLEAAAFGEVDFVRGVSECVAIGARARIGTGVCTVKSSFARPTPDVLDRDEDDIVFTSVDADVDQQTYRGESNPIELPFVERSSVSQMGSMSLLPASIQHSFLQISPQTTSSGAYAPSSPRQALTETRKRKYIPSSPRARVTHLCLSSDAAVAIER